MGKIRYRALRQARGPIALYAHIPFCETKCTYCDYETVPLSRHSPPSIQSYVDALCAELAAISRALPGGIEAAGFDLGGGTPGVLSSTQVEQILRTVDRHFRPSPAFEVSIETTPTLAAGDPAKWKSIAQAGVSRASMGIQTAAPALLTRLNRGMHDSTLAARGMDSLRAAGFAIVNADVMFALPRLDDFAWDATLDLCLALAPDVITTYDTVYKSRAIARSGVLPSPDVFGRQYDHAFAKLNASGWRARYGSVNFSRVPGRLGTSRYLEGRILDGLDYAGAGLYASSLIGDSWRFGKKSYAAWMKSAGELSAEDLYELPRAHVMAKFVLLALSYGFLDSARFERRFGETLAIRFAPALSFLEQRGLLRRAPDGWEMIPGTFAALPGIRACFLPDDALPSLSRPV